MAERSIPMMGKHDEPNRIASEREFDLDELVEAITLENRHDETDWGPPVGGEFW